MRACTALLTLLLLVVVTTADRVACQDGCTDPQEHRSESPSPSTCGLCHGWSGPVVETPASPRVTALARTVTPDDPDHTAHLPAIEHPPRLA